MTFEPFVDVLQAAEFLSVTPRRVLELTRAGKIPAHPLDPDSKKKQWRYRLSELSTALEISFRKPPTPVEAIAGRTSAR